MLWSVKILQRAIAATFQRGRSKRRAFSAMIIEPVLDRTKDSSRPVGRDMSFQLVSQEELDHRLFQPLVEVPASLEETR